jgi:hypothetical protein
MVGIGRVQTANAVSLHVVNPDIPWLQTTIGQQCVVQRRIFVKPWQRVIFHQEQGKQQPPAREPPEVGNNKTAAWCAMLLQQFSLCDFVECGSGSGGATATVLRLGGSMYLSSFLC